MQVMGHWKKAVFISLEGVDGAGKTTHITWLRDYLQQHANWRENACLGVE
jgi:thymidylate kinase